MTCSPGSMPLRISALPSAFSPTVTEPGFHDAVADDLDDGAFRAVEHGRERHQGAVAAVHFDRAAREGADGEAGDGIDRQADAAEPRGAVDFGRDQPDAWRAPALPCRPGGPGPSGRRGGGRARFPARRPRTSMVPPPMMRNSGSAAEDTRAPSRASRRLIVPAAGALISVRARRTWISRRLSFRQFLVGLGEAEGVLGDRGRGRGRPGLAASRCSSVSADVLPRSSSAAGAGEGGVGLADSSPPLRRSGSSAWAMAASARESEAAFWANWASSMSRDRRASTWPRVDRVAFLGQQFGDRQAVDLGPDHDFVAGDQRAGQQDRFRQRAGLRRWRR